MAAPPSKAGAEKLTLAWASPAVAVPMVGAPGTTAFTVKERLTCKAASWVPSPAWSAATVQVPVLRKVRAPTEVTVQTPGVDEEKVGVSPEVAVAERAGAVPKSCPPGSAKVMVWFAFAVTPLEALEAEPVPTALVAVTVKV